MTEAKLYRMTALTLAIWAFSCLGIYVVSVEYLELHPSFVIAAVGLTILTTGPIVIIASAKNFTYSKGDHRKEQDPAAATPILVLSTAAGAFGVTVMSAVSAIAMQERGESSSAALLAIFSAGCAWLGYRRLGKLRSGT